ncbi:MAG: glutaminase family protein [Gemmataceae bacterium]
MRKLAVLVAFFACHPLRAAEEAIKPLRPPAVPLVACDPYFSIWSPADKLSDAATMHWTGKPQPLTSLVRIDGKTYRLMGTEPKDVPPLPQTSLEVLPTRTIYTFEGAGIRITLTFTTPALPDDVAILSRPVTYLTWEAISRDKAEHEIAVYFDSSMLPAVNTPNQKVVWSPEKIDGLAALRAGSKDQPILQKRGDDLRIDWGYLYVAVAKEQNPRVVIADATSARSIFASVGLLGGNEAVSPPTAAGKAPVLAVGFDLGKVGSRPVSRWLIYAYDDIYAIQYFKKNLRPYWRKDGWQAADLLKASAREYTDLMARCKKLDEELMADMTKLGGSKYARIIGLAYRQTFAGCKIAADAADAPLIFPKENFSNGCIGTVDVIYPMAPQFLLFGPTLTKAILVQNLDYAASPRWKFPFAPHDLGTYPLANGQVYGGGERTEKDQMPVEETGNMLILLAALAKMEGNADFAALYWPTVRKWAGFLKAKGFDPENQLCTDDFAGHLAHNVNLSAKAIVALGAYAQLCRLRGEDQIADETHTLAKSLAVRWLKEAEDGDHYRLAFDRKSTWSQKYNLVWDKILGLGLFPEETLQKEMAFYLKTQKKYGLPLDNRQTYTKIDWTLWTACLTGERRDFDALVAPVYDFLNATPERAPMTDWYQTPNARRVGFTARPVVGGLLLRALYDSAMWKKFAGRDKTKTVRWAALPKPPKIVAILPAADESAASWHYTLTKPTPQWIKPDFDDSAWKQGQSGFGTRGTPGAIVGTTWDTADIWLRRAFELPDRKYDNPQLWIHHDEDADVYINGVLAARVTGYVTGYDAVPMTPAARAALKPGKNVLAVHCHQTGGGQYIDVGIVDAIEQK